MSQTRGSIKAHLTWTKVLQISREEKHICISEVEISCELPMMSLLKNKDQHRPIVSWWTVSVTSTSRSHHREKTKICRTFFSTFRIRSQLMCQIRSNLLSLSRDCLTMKATGKVRMEIRCPRLKSQLVEKLEHLWPVLQATIASIYLVAWTALMKTIEEVRISS